MRVGWLAGFLFATASAGLAADTWIVAADGTGDFLEIQDAVENASANDLILVKDGSYRAVWIDKPISIVGSGDETIITGEGSIWINYPVAVYFPDQSAGNVNLASLRTFTSSVGVGAGPAPNTRLTLWNVTLEQDGSDGRTSGSSISAASLESIWINNCRQAGKPPWEGSTREFPGLSISASPVFVSESSFQAQDIFEFFSGTVPGGSGVRVRDGSTAYIAESAAIGGVGGFGYQLGCIVWYAGGRGGHGVQVGTDSSAQIVSRSNHLLQGADGGDFINIDDCDDPPGGDGGDGINATEPGSVAWYAGVCPKGGLGGDGEPPGEPGIPTRGNVNELPSLWPTSTMEGNGHPGSKVIFHFHADPGEQLRILYSTELDVTELPRFDGHPLMTSPAGTFGVIDGGKIPSTGTATFSFQIPPDLPLGQGFYVQGLLVDSDHPPQFTNMSMFICSPDW